MSLPRFCAGLINAISCSGLLRAESWLHFERMAASRRGIAGEHAIKRPATQIKERRLRSGRQTQGHATRSLLVWDRFGSGVETAGETA